MIAISTLEKKIMEVGRWEQEEAEGGWYISADGESRVTFIFGE